MSHGIDGTLYAMSDIEPRGVFKVSLDEAKRLNSGRMHGIFWSVNAFDGPRQLEHLSAIKSWYLEVDKDKEKAEARLKRSPLFPSMVVETKRGYHIYFFAKEASERNYAFIQDNLVFHFDGDIRVKDLARVLRVPGFYHWKNPKEPYLVRKVFELPVSYSDADMLAFFPSPKKSTLRATDENKSVVVTGDGLTSKLNGLDQGEILMALSGTSYVNGETYELKKGSKGKLNIWVNGKSTSCFIDSEKRIGAKPGGPTVWQWLRYFGHSDAEIARILHKVIGL